jgi:hypothetical protein
VIELNSRKIFTASTLLRTLFAALIFFVLMHNGTKEICVFARSVDIEPEKDDDKTSPPSRARSDEGSPAEGTPAETEDVNGPWSAAKDFGTKIDWIHENLYNSAQHQLDRFDSCFKSTESENPAAPSRFRVGIYGIGRIKGQEQPGLGQTVDIDTEIGLPNIRRRMKLIITTSDPTTLPGRYFADQPDRSLRTALLRQWQPDVATSVGLRLRLRPELFAYAAWSHAWKTGSWGWYPQQKFYWENDNGIGEITTLVLDHWINRWDTRFSSSIKWSKQDSDADRLIRREDKGFRWSEVFILDRANELLDETRLGRIVSGDDVARGWGIKLAAFGGFHFFDEYRAGMFYRRPLRKKWIYLLIEPDISWKNTNNWNREWTIKCGIEMLFWGGKER